MQAVFAPSKVVPGLVYRASAQAPNRSILLGGRGSFERAHVTFTKGCFIEGGAEQLAERFGEISNRDGDMLTASAQAQKDTELSNARAAATRQQVREQLKE